MDNKNKKLLYLALGGLILILLLAISLIFKNLNKSEKVTENKIPKLKQDESFSFDDMLGFENYNRSHKNESFVENKIKKRDSIDALFNNLSDALTKGVEEIEQKEDIKDQTSDLMRKMQLLQSQNMPTESPTPKPTPTAAPKEPTKPKVKELSTEDKILAYRKKMGWDDPKPTVAPKKAAAPKESKPYKIAIFMDQYVLPDDLVELRLMEQIEYNNKTFQKGTPIYAYITIKNNRILFDIANISHVPMEIEVRDLRDGRIGMHSSRAGELWKLYQDQAKNETQDGIVEVATEEVRSGILRKGIESLSSFFKRKRIRQRDKILLIDDHQLMLKIKG